MYLIIDLVRNELQHKYPDLSIIHQPLVSMDFGNGPLKSLMTSGRLFDVHKNLPSKGNMNFSLDIIITLFSNKLFVMLLLLLCLS